ncbi:hypothetical protein HU200_028246 [Digitaria exilis]|uniref:Uncharacterized protein n=1 Tax=Digitaria exilis TaxID=1010633 RepID=A0A835BSQ1_9POAL|nr:hypothetical protein HU200_028246 [Digitaria exilis]
MRKSQMGEEVVWDVDRDLTPEEEKLSKYTLARSYFDACSDSVKPCVFYLSVFPSGSKIRRRRFIRRWIAEDYSRETPGSTAEENAASLFFELVNLSIIQQTENKLMSQVNTFLLEYIISQPMEDNLVFALEGSCSPNTQRSGRHLTIRSSWDRDINVFKGIDFSRLRSLTVLGEWRTFFISKKFGMRVLRVLDLEDSVGVTYHDLEEIGRLIPRLKFLSLRGCRQIKQLPDSFGGLSQLQTLDVRHTSIVMLPPTIFQIEKLQYIRVGTSAWHADDGMLTIVEAVDDTTTTPPIEDGDHTSTAQQDGDGNSPWQDSDETGSSASSISIPSHAHDDTTPVQLEEDGDHTSTIQQDGNGSLPRQNGAETAQILQAADRYQASPTHGDGYTSRQGTQRVAKKNNKSTCPWVSWLSKVLHASALNEGVEVPTAARIGKLTTLHTLGVINVNGAGGKAILKKQELNKLTQLRKLRVSGVNSGNAKDFFSAISDHRHMESLSLQLDEDNFLEGTSLPKLVAETPKSLKLYGNIKKLPVSWIKQLGNLKKLKLELTVSGQDDIDAFSCLAHINIKEILTHLCVKLSQGGELNFGDGDSSNSYISLAVLEIDCISSSVVTFRCSPMYSYVQLLKVRCSKEVSLTFSGLEYLVCLKEVWLMGSFDDDKLKQEMLQQLGKNHYEPVLKLVKQPSS